MKFILSNWTPAWPGLNESRQLARQFAYAEPVLSGKHVIDLTRQYENDARRAAADQLSIAAARLASLIKQYKALLGTEGIDLNFTEESIVAIANIAAEINASIENIGARRLHTVMERVLDELSYSATDRSGEAVTIDEAYVQKHVGDLAKNSDLSKFIL